jgi:hypothetical protein
VAVSSCPSKPNQGGDSNSNGVFGFNDISQLEKDVFVQQNLVRTNPKSFVPYLQN